MKTKDIWILDYCVPAAWTNELTPPSDWDYALQPGSWDELSESLSNFIMIVGKGFTACFNQVEKNLAPVVEVIQQSGHRIAPIFDEIIETKRILDEHELKKNGQHVIKSQKEGINLPKRITNSGPPAPRLDRKRK